MIAFIPTLAGASANILDMTDAIAPFSGAVLVGMFLSSLAGLVITVFADRWLTQRQQRVLTAEAADLTPIRRAA